MICRTTGPACGPPREQQVRSPLAECGLTKNDVRALARQWDLPIWDKPATPCLSSRIAYGEQVTVERLAMIDRAEQFLRQRGFATVRVRYHKGDLARIEVPLPELPRLLHEDLRARGGRTFPAARLQVRHAGCAGIPLRQLECAGPGGATSMKRVDVDSVGERACRFRSRSVGTEAGQLPVAAAPGTRRHGGRLSGRADFAASASGLQGSEAESGRGSGLRAPVSQRGARSGLAGARQHRADP